MGLRRPRSFGFQEGGGDPSSCKRFSLFRFMPKILAFFRNFPLRKFLFFSTGQGSPPLPSVCPFFSVCMESFLQSSSIFSKNRRLFFFFCLRSSPYWPIVLPFQPVTRCSSRSWDFLLVKSLFWMTNDFGQWPRLLGLRPLPLNESFEFPRGGASSPSPPKRGFFPGRLF